MPKKTPELRPFKVAILNCFEESNQETIELDDSEASAEKVKWGGGRFLTKLYRLNSILQSK